MGFEQSQPARNRLYAPPSPDMPQSPLQQSIFPSPMGAMQPGTSRAGVKPSTREQARAGQTAVPLMSPPTPAPAAAPAAKTEADITAGWGPKMVEEYRRRKEMGR